MNKNPSFQEQPCELPYNHECLKNKGNMNKLDSYLNNMKWLNNVRSVDNLHYYQGMYEREINL